MKKLNIGISFDSYNTFHESNHSGILFNGFTNIIKEHFNIFYIDNPIPFDKNDTLLAVNCMDIVNKKPLWCENLYQDGYKILIDTLWCLGDYSFDRAFNLSNKNWFWYHESLLATQLGYDQYRPNKTYIKLGLMPMGLIKQSHELLYEAMIPYLDNFYYSYVERLGKYLPYDIDPLFSISKGSTGQQQRYFTPRWYDDTYFSLVSETVVSSNFDLHVTEKTFKPIAYYHPYMIWGQPGILKYLKSLGFETYENLFDESYDDVLDLDSRLKIIINNVKNFNSDKYDSLTLKKIQHNHDLFFDNSYIKQRIIKEIVDPIYEWFETKQ